MALNEEYKKRYNHTDDHIAVQKLGVILSEPPKNAKINKIATDPQPPMPDECKVPGDAVQSYRNYYVMKKEDLLPGKSLLNARMHFIKCVKFIQNEYEELEKLSLEESKRQTKERRDRVKI